MTRPESYQLLDSINAGSTSSKRIDADEFGQKLAQTMIEKTLWQDDLTKPGVVHWVEYSQTASEIFTSPMCHGRPNYLQNLGLLEDIRPQATKKTARKSDKKTDTTAYPKTSI